MKAAGFRRVADLAAAANIHTQKVRDTVCFRKTGIRNIRVKNLIALAHVLKTTPGHLLDKTLEEEGYTDAVKVGELVNTFANQTTKVAAQISILNQSLDLLTAKHVTSSAHRSAIRELVYQALAAVPTATELNNQTADISALKKSSETLKLMTDWADSLGTPSGNRLVLHFRNAAKTFDTWITLTKGE